jgi:hypothetical protein
MVIGLSYESQKTNINKLTFLKQIYVFLKFLSKYYWFIKSTTDSLKIRTEMVEVEYD